MKIGRRSRKNDPDRKRRILDATLDVLVEHGIAETTHRRIAAHAHVPLGSITYHFASLIDLQTQAFGRYVELQSTVFENLFECVETREQLVEVLVEFVHGGAARQRSAVLGFELHLAALRNPELRALTEAWTEHSRAILARFTDPDSAARLDALLEGMIMHALLSTTPQPRDKTRAAIDRTLAGERTQENPVTRSMSLISVTDPELDELRARLRDTRWPTPWPAIGWDAGTEPDQLQRLVDYWARDYDWRTHEAAINALPSHFADIDGTPVHYLRFDGEHPDSLPIVLTHGWPSSFLELTDLARRLATPSQYGGNADDAFTVILPSLPGFTFSPQRSSLLEALPTHEIWHRLMHDELGFERYAAHGGDLGAGVTSRLGEAHPEALVGIHLLAIADPVRYDVSSVTPEEQAYLDAVAAWSSDEGGYQHQQKTRPLTLSYGLADSPTGLLAWIVEKYRAWSDRKGDLSTRFSDDFLLTQASLYWFTNTISTSFRPYYEHGKGLTRRVEHVSVPTAVAVFPADLTQPPRSWAERTYNITRYTLMPRGGHFAAHEEPELLASDLTEFFRAIR